MVRCNLKRLIICVCIYIYVYIIFFLLFPDTKPEITASTEITPPVSGNTESSESEDNQQTPSIVIYLVEPFTHGSADLDVYRLATLGLLRSYTHMLQFLPEHIRNNIHLQVNRIIEYFKDLFMRSSV